MLREPERNEGLQMVQDRMRTNQSGMRWCFTINNFRPDEMLTLETHLRDIENKTHEIMTALIFEVEHANGEEQHHPDWTPHIQGFFRLASQKQRSWIVRHIPGFARAHLEIAKGTDQQNIEYCSKEGNAQKAGTFRSTAGEQKKKVWDDIRDLVNSGATLEQLRDEYPAQYLARQAGLSQWVCEVYGDQHPEPWDGDLKQKNIWVWGPPGTGKSRWAHSLAGRKYIKNTNKWWDGFARQPIVIIEDLDPTRCASLVQHLKIWADRYLFNGEVKGGTRPIRPDYKLIITSNYHPDTCFQNTEDLDAIKRRFTICCMDMAGTVPAWPS